MNNRKYYPRKYYLGCFILSALLLGAAYYLQYAESLKPCALCILQRVAYYTIALVSLVVAIINPKQIWQKIFAAALSVISLSGLLITARQTWLQYFALTDTGCGPNLNFMLQNFPLSQIVKTLFYGAGDCAAVTWRFVGLSMAEWSVLFFCGFLAVFLYLFFKRR
jgi:disulfide bond formation protein DsbB